MSLITRWLLLLIVKEEGIVRLIRKYLDICDVGSTHPGAVEGPKGQSVSLLKRYASWVQTVVRQVGLYPLSTWEF